MISLLCALFSPGIQQKLSDLETPKASPPDYPFQPPYGVPVSVSGSTSHCIGHKTHLPPRTTGQLDSTKPFHTTMLITSHVTRHSSLVIQNIENHLSAIREMNQALLSHSHFPNNLHFLPSAKIAHTQQIGPQSDPRLSVLHTSCLVVRTYIHTNTHTATHHMPAFSHAKKQRYAMHHNVGLSKP